MKGIEGPCSGHGINAAGVLSALGVAPTATAEPANAAPEIANQTTLRPRTRSADQQRRPLSYAGTHGGRPGTSILSRASLHQSLSDGTHVGNRPADRRKERHGRTRYLSAAVPDGSVSLKSERDATAIDRESLGHFDTAGRSAQDDVPGRPRGSGIRQPPTLLISTASTRAQRRLVALFLVPRCG